MNAQPNEARNLLLLAIDAFKNKQYDTAGTLFTASLSSEDAPELINELDAAAQAAMSQPQETATASGRVPRSVIASSIAASMSSSDLEDEEDEDEDEEIDDAEDVPDEEDEDEDEIASSISSAEPRVGSVKKLVSTTKSPVKLRIQL